MLLPQGQTDVIDSSGVNAGASERLKYATVSLPVATALPCAEQKKCSHVFEP